MTYRFLLSILLLVAIPAMAQLPGPFTPTGGMTKPRVNHTATLLPDGKVLLAGGVFSSSAYSFSVSAGAELYDPSTGAFRATGNMTTARAWHTATLLPNGKVLIAGGESNDASLRSADLYAPSEGTFVPTGDMTAARSAHTATLLNNGKVLIAGGLSACCVPYGHAMNSAELYDPSTGTFEPAANMTAGRCQHKATLLTDGKVLIVPGGNCGPLGGAELYDPEAGRFSFISADWGRGLLAGTASTASLLTNGKVLLTLECDDGAGQCAALYDASTGTFAATGLMSTARGDSTATLLPDGTVLVDGRDYSLGGTDNADLYNPATGTFSPVAIASPLVPEGHTATLLPDGTVLFTGGWYGAPTAGAAIYRPRVLTPSLVLLTVSSDGNGAILHAATHQLVSADNPAFSGEALEIYGAGLIDGAVIPPQMDIGGQMAEVLFFGKAPEYEGLNQVNVRVPGGVAAGDAVPVRLNYLSRPSNGVTISVR
jgi:hypothetical protein